MRPKRNKNFVMIVILLKKLLGIETKYDRIDYLWESGREILNKYGLHTSTSNEHLEKLVGIYTEIIGIVGSLDKSQEYRATSSLRNRALTYRALQNFDVAIEDLKQEMAIAQRKHVGWQVAECRRLIAETQEMKRKAEIETRGGDKAAKFKIMAKQAENLFIRGSRGEAAFESLFSDLKNDDADVRAEASRLLAESPTAIERLVSMYQKCRVSDPSRASLAARVLGRNITKGTDGVFHAKHTQMLYGIPIDFIPCSCVYCSNLNKGIPATGGAWAPYYAQKEGKGASATPVLCDQCGKEFFVVWD